MLTRRLQDWTRSIRPRWAMGSGQHRHRKVGSPVPDTLEKVEAENKRKNRISWIIGSLAIAVVLLVTYILWSAQLGRDSATAERDSAAAQVVDLATQIQSECSVGRLTGPICADANDAKANPVPGPQGPPGETGPAGATGGQGPIGPIGPAGQQGVPGPIGPVGPAGDQGPVGPAGAAGEDGTDGADGPQGERGPAGPQGPPGPEGDPGPQGPQGPQGPEGDAGPACPDGEEPAQVIYLSGETGTACVDSP